MRVVSWKGVATIADLRAIETAGKYEVAMASAVVATYHHRLPRTLNTAVPCISIVCWPSF